MRISVVVPALNEEKRIAACIDSLKRQSLKPFEIVVADGGSKDATRAIARKKGCRVVVEHERTIAAGRQCGCLAARGDILAFTDADAVLDRSWLKELCAPLRDPGVVCVFGSLELLDATWLEAFLSNVLKLVFGFTALISKPTGAGNCMACRADAFRKSGGFNVDLVTAEDIDLQKKLARYGRIVYAPKAVARVSPRRVRKWGYLRFTLFHAGNWVNAHFFGRAATTYEKVR
ncbi:MAG: glycosyltransferase [Candidatus Micrarchaeia archaeon]